jgi:hypothetical protein
MSPKTTDPRESIAVVGGKPALPSDEVDGVGPSKLRRGGFWDGNWITFTFLMPAVLMCVGHVVLGISNAALMGDRFDATYNLVMELVLFLGSCAFVVHAFALPLTKGYGWRWVAPKLIFMAFVWAASISVLTFMSRSAL